MIRAFIIHDSHFYSGASVLLLLEIRFGSYLKTAETLFQNGPTISSHRDDGTGIADRVRVQVNGGRGSAVVQFRRNEATRQHSPPRNHHGHCVEFLLLAELADRETGSGCSSGGIGHLSLRRNSPAEHPHRYPSIGGPFPQRQTGAPAPAGLSRHDQFDEPILRSAAHAAGRRFRHHFQCPRVRGHLRPHLPQGINCYLKTCFYSTLIHSQIISTGGMRAIPCGQYLSDAVRMHFDCSSTIPFRSDGRSAITRRRQRLRQRFLGRSGRPLWYSLCCQCLRRHSFTQSKTGKHYGTHLYSTSTC